MANELSALGGAIASALDNAIGTGWRLEVDASSETGGVLARALDFALGPNWRGNDFANLSEFKEAIEDGFTREDGHVVLVGGIAFQAQSGVEYGDAPSGWAPSGVATPEHFGMSEGAVDNSTGLAAALSYDGAVDWGDKTYFFATAQGITRVSSIRWSASGCTLVYDGPIAQRAIDIEMDGSSFSLDGDLTFDANGKAFDAFYCENAAGGDRPTFSAAGLRAQNAYRSSTDFIGGNGIWIRGGWRTIYLERPSAYNCYLAKGAGVSGSQGIFGITISASTQFPDEVTIIAPDISEIYSEDPTYKNDQDGLRIFTENDSDTDTMIWPTHFKVTGGRFHNCRNRSIKSQCEMGIVQGAKFVRNAGWEDGSGSPVVGGAEVDFQTGGGFLIDCEYHYTDHAPTEIARFSGTRDTGEVGRLSSGGTVRGAKIFLKNTPQMDRLVRFSPMEAESYSISIEDVQLISSDTRVDSIVTAGIDGASGTVRVLIDGFVGRLADEMVNLQGAATCRLSVENATNLATAIPVLTTTATVILTTVNVSGINGKPHLFGGNVQVEGSLPEVALLDKDDNNLVRLIANGGTFIVDIDANSQVANPNGYIRMQGADVMQLRPDGRVIFSGSPIVPSYTVATAPNPAIRTGGLIYVSNGAAGSPVLAFSNGSAWLRCDTLAAISTS